MRRDGEIPGQDYHFISRQQFEADILSRKFVEHGEYEKAYYGKKLSAISNQLKLVENLIFIYFFHSQAHHSKPFEQSFQVVKFVF